MSGAADKPLITFAVFAYKQEHLIREAVAAVLAQTYSPLEIILSDDRSPDRTYEILEEMAADYRGLHKVVLNRNATNLGPLAHVNHVVTMAKGELIVVAAGDDVSMPERTQMIFEAWDSTGRKATSLHSRIIHIDEQGKEIKHPNWHKSDEPTRRFVEQPTTATFCVDKLKPAVFGCSGAYARSLFETFGALPTDSIHEDNLLTLRSVLLGRVVFIDAPLVKYRLHGNNLYNARSEGKVTLDSIRIQEERMRRDFLNRAGMYRAFCKDLSKARELGILPEDEYSKASAIGRRKEGICTLQASYMISNPARKVSLLIKLARAGVESRQLKELSARLLPAPVFASVKLARGWLSACLNQARP